MPDENAFFGGWHCELESMMIERDKRMSSNLYVRQWAFVVRENFFALACHCQRSTRRALVALVCYPTSVKA
jgi:hypothetical protein